MTTIDHTTGPVEVYFNLHKRLFSVRSKGRVIEHTRHIAIKGAKFVVQPAGRAKVLREKKKNVHAFVRGSRDRDDVLVPSPVHAYYNPYEGDKFTDERGNPVTDAEVAVLYLDHTGRPQIIFND